METCVSDQTAQDSPLLESKLRVPRRRLRGVARPRLTERLTAGLEATLTLVSAPPGFGKTTLLADWLAADQGAERSVAWLLIDAGDNDPARFWTHLIAALQVSMPGLGATALALIRAGHPPLERVLTTLLNDLGAVANDVVLTLDDYHLVDASEIEEGMAFLLEHLPRQAHVVISTRADPLLPLARLRARGELVEVRAADLRFTRDEAAAYLNETMGLDLATRDIAALEWRTEGWIAALQLAALSMQGRDDATGFIDDFAGDDRYIVDYLAEEVLQRQPDGVRTFLLQTAILSRMSGPLCDAVTGQPDGKATLDALDRGNLFLIPLDDRRRWYRYHQLFADVLRARLVDERPGDVPDLHRRASDWYERHGERFEAIRHALAVEDDERAADLIELAIPALRQGRQEATLRHLVDQIPPELVRVRPVLSIGWVGSRLVSGDFEGVEERLADAERWLDTTATHGATGATANGMVVVDDDAFRRLPAAIAMYRTALARAAGDVDATIANAQRLLDAVGENEHLERGAAAGFLGLGYWTRGDLDAAHRAWADAVENLELAGHLSDVLGCTIALADIRIAQGRLGDAMRHAEWGLGLATRTSGPPLRGAADMHVALSEVLRERNDLDAALQHLQASEAMGEPAAPRPEPVPVVRRHGRRARRRGRPRRGHRAARRGRAPVRERLLPECSADLCAESPRVHPASTAGGRNRLGPRGRGLDRRRPQLSPGVRSRDPRPLAPGSDCGRAARRGAGGAAIAGAAP
jgi:LuxR family maltose regulon positive regulatory protein